jgi:hypothetical protein
VGVSGGRGVWLAVEFDTSFVILHDLKKKQIPLCAPRQPKCGGTEKAQDSLRDDNHIESKIKDNINGKVKPGRLKNRRPLQIQN